MAALLPPVSREQIGFDYIRHLIGGDARTILEIGANDGLDTAQFLAFFPQAAIWAFEPDPRAIRKFNARIGDPRAHLFETAIGAADGEAEFHISGGMPPNIPARIQARYPEGWDQSGSLRAPKAHKAAWPWCEFESTTMVKVRSLDSWAREHGIGPVDFLWADVQGSEGDLIDGGQATLARTRYLYTEYSNDELYEGEPNLRMLLDMLPNFSVVKLYSADVLLRNDAS
jgi:FkbM family methyltransferase